MYFLSHNIDDLGFSSFEEEISRRAKIGDTKSYLYIVPTGAAARELINWVTELCEGQAIKLPNILSLDDFINRLAKSIRPDLRVLSDAESGVFIELALKDLLRQNKLQYFEGESDAGAKLPIRRGTFERLVSAIAGLKESGVTPEKLAKDIIRAESNGDRLIADRSAIRCAHDLAMIYEAYQAKLGAEFTDANGQYAIIAEYFELPATVITEGQRKRIHKLINNLFSDVTDIFVGSFIRIHEPARQILFALSNIEEIRLTFGVDYEKRNEPLFSLQERFVRQAADNGLTLIAPTESKTNLPPTVSEFQKSLRTLYFTSKNQTQITGVKIYSHAALTMRDELRFAIKRIKELACDPKNPVELSRICIASYTQADYAELAREVFREFGIPANITDRARLDRSPLYLAFNALFDLAEFNYNRRSLLRLLSSPYLLITDEEGRKVDAANLYEVITEFRLRHGSTSWLKEIDVLLEDFRAEENLAMDDFDQQELEEKIDKLVQAKKDIEIVERLVNRLKGNKNPSQFHKVMLGIIKDCNVVSQILTASNVMISADSLEFDTRCYRAFVTLLEELDDICSQLGLNTSSLPLSFYTERIRIASLRTRFAPRAEPGRGVIVTSFEQTIGYEFDHLFLIGLNDGVFPEVFSPSIFSLKEHQPSEDDKLIEQRYLFYQTLCTFRKEAYLIWHTGSDDRKSEIMRSQFVDALEEIVQFSEILDDENDKNIFSANEFFRYAARSDLNPSQVVELAEDQKLDENSSATLALQIPHSTHIEKMRSSGSLNEYTGVLSFDELTESEREELLTYRNRVYSISQLETYAACPFKFFSKYILRLESGLRSDSEEGLSGAERGSILHDSLYQILSGLRERNEDIRSLSDDDFHRISAEILLDKNKSDMPGKNHPFWQLDKESVFEPPAPGSGILQKFIEAEKQYANFITKPSFFEATFGIKAAESKRDKELYREEYVEVDGIKLRGKIDRIDMDASSGIFSVTDYKSGKSATQKDIQKGLSLQIPLYLRIAEDLLRAHLGDETMYGVAGIYHSLLGKDSKQKLALGIHEFAGKAFEGHKRGGKLRSEVETQEDMQEIIQATIDFAKSYVEGITQGLFPLVKAEDQAAVCTYCEYKQVCRVCEALENGTLRK